MPQTPIRWIAYEQSGTLALAPAGADDERIIGYYRRDRAGRWVVGAPARSRRGWDLTVHDDETACRAALQRRADSSTPTSRTCAGPATPAAEGSPRTDNPLRPSGAGTPGPAVPASDAAAGLGVHKTAAAPAGARPHETDVGGRRDAQ